MRKRTIQKISAATAVAALSLSIGVGSAGAVKPESPGNSGNAPGHNKATGVNGNGQSKPNPARTCKAERESLGVDAFRAKYGSNENGKNAFGKCVSAQRQQDPAPTS